MYSEMGSCVVEVEPTVANVEPNTIGTIMFDVEVLTPEYGRMAHDTATLETFVRELASGIQIAFVTNPTAEDYLHRFRPDVARAAQVLDERKPGWHERIDVDRLDIANPHRCILGQVYASGWNRLFHTWTDGYTRGMWDVFPYLQNGNINSLVFSTNVFRSTWIEEINDRRRQGAAA